jgi:hypothetical protein
MHSPGWQLTKREEHMATAKKAKKSAKHLRKARKLEEQKTLTKLSSPTPTETVSLPFNKIEFKYMPQGS